MIVDNCLQPESCFFLLPFRVLKRKSNIFSCLKTSKYTSQTSVYAFQPLRISRVYGLLHFNLEKHQSLFDSWFLTIEYLIHGSFWVFKALSTSAVPFVSLCTVHKRWSDLSWSGFASENNLRHTLIYVFLPQKMSSVRRLLHWNLQNHHSYFAFSFLSTADLIHSLFWGF